VETKTLHDAEDALSWRTGYLNFDETALTDAIAEFNRYTPRQIRVEDPRLAAVHITGRFRATNTDAFIRVLQNGFGVQVHASQEEIVLTSAK
jgi:transmembrane sensor